MRNSLRILHVTLFSCLVKLFYFSVLLSSFFLDTFMVNKDEYIKFTYAQHIYHY